MTPDLEDVIQGALDLFKASFNQTLEAVDNSKSKVLGLKPPAVYIFGDTNQTPILPCMVFTGHSTREDTDDDRGWRKQTYPLEIEAYVTGDSVENISRAVRRWGAAIDTFLRNNPTLGGLAGVRNVTNITQNYWDTMSSKSVLFQVCKVTFDVQLITT